MMHTVSVLAPRENWIVDRFVKEWSEDNPDITVSDPVKADVIWLLADWAWDQLPVSLLRLKRVITTVHHIVPEKFDVSARQVFELRDSITDAYHVYNQRTFDFISSLTKKPIHLIPYWANDSLFKKVTFETINDVSGIKPTLQRL